MFSDVYEENKQLQFVCLVIYTVCTIAIFVKQSTMQYFTLHLQKNKVENINKFYEKSDTLRHAAKITAITPKLLDKFVYIFKTPDTGYSVLTLMMTKTKIDFIVSCLTLTNIYDKLSSDFQVKTISYLKSLIKELDVVSSVDTSLFKKYIQELNYKDYNVTEFVELICRC